MVKLFISLISLAAVMMLSYYAMTIGWGLTVANWPALLVGYGSILIINMFLTIIKEM